MALHYGLREIVNLKKAHDSITKQAARVKAFGTAVEETVVTSAEVGGMAFAMGVVQGKYGDRIPVKILDRVPISLVTGLALHLVAFNGKSKNAEHLHAFGDGALAAWANSVGRDWGRDLQTPADRERITGFRHSMAGELDGVTGGASLADEELARMVATAR